MKIISKSDSLKVKYLILENWKDKWFLQKKKKYSKFQSIKIIHYNNTINYLKTHPTQKHFLIQNNRTDRFISQLSISSKPKTKQPHYQLPRNNLTESSKFFPDQTKRPIPSIHNPLTHTHTHDIPPTPITLISHTSKNPTAETTTGNPIRETLTCEASFRLEIATFGGVPFFLHANWFPPPLLLPPERDGSTPGARFRVRAPPFVYCYQFFIRRCLCRLAFLGWGWEGG